MKYVVSGICRSTGFVTTQEVEAADSLAADSIASADMIVFDVEPAPGQPAPEPTVHPRRGHAAPVADITRRLAFACSLLILAGLLVWSESEKSQNRPQASPAALPAVASSARLPTQPALPPFARDATADRLGPTARIPLSH